MRFLLIAVLLFCFSCDGDPIFSNLDQSDIIIVFKASYASNDPRSWWDGASPSANSFIDDSAVNSVPENLPDKVLIDIGEVRANNDRFSIERFYRNADMTDDNELFSGKGITVPTSDLFPDKNYDTIKVFFRKLIYNQASYYNHSWEYIDDNEEKFGNSDLPGYDSIHRLKYEQADYDEDEDEVNNIVYPFVIDLPIPFEYKVGTKTIIEIRINFKNSLKYYEYGDSDNEYYYGYYSLADSFVNVVEGDFYIGGNIQAGVNIYETEKTLIVKGSAPAGRYVVAIHEDDDISNYIGTTLIPPLATWCDDGSYKLNNIESGKRYKFYYSSTTPPVNGVNIDGFSGEKIVEFEESDINTEVELNL
ncbi:MAG: hypothetical protein PF637_00595 [Spirochaetes bacterium]|jgi:hypothetical protein|nr:hypothetical protein [Spirochaetota bacterium]